MPDRLRRCWDFDDLDGTEQRFRDQLDREPDDAGRAELLTQLARVEGLRGDFDGCERLLAEAEGLAGVALRRTKLHRVGGAPFGHTQHVAGAQLDTAAVCEAHAGQVDRVADREAADRAP